ncbi:hypothetical protein C8R43DRAFT_1229287 [Mycena crocata]|nr:hypothetical protein C8R43DRAFT_1229287 [Mycena crocata]
MAEEAVRSGRGRSIDVFPCLTAESSDPYSDPYSGPYPYPGHKRRLQYARSATVRLQEKHSYARATSKASSLLTRDSFSLLKSLLVAGAILVPSIVAGPTPLEASLAKWKREECCDPDFFFPCMISEILLCSPDNIDLCSLQAEQDCLALCALTPGATPPLCPPEKL